MADKLDRAIAEAKAALEGIHGEIAALERRRDIVAAQIEAFLLAASLRPPAPPVPRKGRQRGAISAEWRGLLHAIYMIGESDYAIINEMAQGMGIRTEISNTRDRVRSFVRNGLMKQIGTNFEVTEEAAERFGFTGEPALEPPEAEYDGVDWEDDAEDGSEEEEDSAAFT